MILNEPRMNPEPPAWVSIAVAAAGLLLGLWLMC